MGYKDDIDVHKSHISKNNKKIFKELKEFININEYKNYCHPQTIFINKKGLLQLLTSSRMPNIDEILKIFGVKNIYRYKKKEIEILDELSIFFNELGIKYKPQEPIGNYKVDIYIPKYNLVIEIDEHDHNDRNKKYEKKREQYFNKLNKCIFIRCNPDEPTFNINILLAKITKHMLNYNT